MLRLVPLAVGAAAMACGLWGGLARLGLVLPGGMPSAVDLHGPLMISGFLGTLISLERAVAIGHGWAYGAPAAGVIGALALIAGMPQLAVVAFVAAGSVLLLASAGIVVRQPALFSMVLALGAGCWMAGTLLWAAGRTMPEVTGWWLAFLILTIAAERLELSRIIGPSASSRLAFVLAMALLLIGSGRGELTDGRAPFTAAALIVAALWLLRHDVARRTIRLRGQPRFSACAILCGHAWLGVAGIVLLTAPPVMAALTYDAAVHAITIGCVLSMVLAHAPIILPAVTGLRLTWSIAVYIPLVLLQASVALRVIGDFLGSFELRTGSGLLTVLAILGYAAVLGTATLERRRREARTQPRRSAPRTAARSSAAS